jgi:hypothetical protein
VCHHPKSHLQLQAIVVIHSSMWFFLPIATCYSWTEINDEVIVNWKQRMWRNCLMDTETNHQGMEQKQLSNLCLLPTAIISKFTFSNHIINCRLHFWGNVLLCRLGWPWTHHLAHVGLEPGDSPASVSWVLRL